MLSRHGDHQSSENHQPCPQARNVAGRCAGDVAIMELVEGPVSFVDTRNNKREGKAHLKPVQTVTAGVAFGRPYGSPFAVR